MEKTVSLAEKGQLDPPIPPPPPPGEGMSFPQPPYRPQMGQAAQITALAVTPPPRPIAPPGCFPSLALLGSPPPSPRGAAGQWVAHPLGVSAPSLPPPGFPALAPSSVPPPAGTEPGPAASCPLRGAFFFLPPPPNPPGQGLHPPAPLPTGASSSPPPTKKPPPPEQGGQAKAAQQNPRPLPIPIRQNPKGNLPSVLIPGIPSPLQLWARERRVLRPKLPPRTLV